MEEEETGGGFWSTFTDFFDWLHDFLTFGLWDELTAWWENIDPFSRLGEIAWKIAKEGLETITDFITACYDFNAGLFVWFSQFYNGLPDSIIGILTIIQVPAGLTMVFCAFLTGFLLRLVIRIFFG